MVRKDSIYTCGNPHWFTVLIPLYRLLLIIMERRGVENTKPFGEQRLVCSFALSVVIHYTYPCLDLSSTPFCRAYCYWLRPPHQPPMWALIAAKAAPVHDIWMNEISIIRGLHHLNEFFMNLAKQDRACGSWLYDFTGWKGSHLNQVV